MTTNQATIPDSQATKRCSRCPHTKPVTEFYASPDYADGYWAKCKKCVREINAAYKQRKRARLTQDAPGESAPTGSTATPAASPSRPSVSAVTGSEPAPACICSLFSVVKDGHRLYGTSPDCPVPGHNRIIGGYEPHKAQKSGAEVKYSGMVYGY